MKNHANANKTAIHRGFVSLEVLGALVIVAMAALFGAEKYSEYLDEQEWKVAATHASLFNEASKQYIADHSDELLNKPLPYRITPSLLIKNGYLQQGFADKNGLGQQYVTGVVKNSTKGQPALQALTCSVQGNALSEKGMRRIAAQITGMGGYVDEKNIATGAYGGWKSQPGDFGLDCRHGHIAIALSSEILGSVLQESDRLYRFQVKHKPELNRMHTHIDMGGNSLNNANQVNAAAVQAGTVQSDGRLTAKEYIQVEGLATAKKACPSNGLLGRNTAGALLYCKDLVWTENESNTLVSTATIPNGSSFICKSGPSGRILVTAYANWLVSYGVYWMNANLYANGVLVATDNTAAFEYDHGRASGSSVTLFYVQATQPNTNATFSLTATNTYLLKTSYSCVGA